MTATLLATRRFLPLFLTQFFNALNDNLFKSAMGILVTYRLAASGASAQVLTAIAAGLFILPYFLFSATAGRVADKFEKARLIVAIKALEIPILMVGAVGLMTQSTPLLLVMLFLTGCQSTFFAPVKYGILPEHLRSDELLPANALIEAATFLAILVGTLAGSALILTGWGAEIVGGGLVLSAVISFTTALLIPRAQAASPELELSFNIVADTREMLSYAASRRVLWLPILGISWFWMVGAAFLTLFPNYAHDSLGGDAGVVSLLLTLFALGIGVGSLLCNRLLNGEVTPKYVPAGAAGLALFSLDLWAASGATPAATAGLADLWSFLLTPAHWRVLADLFLIALSGGFFIVPLYAFIQAKSEGSHRARVIAADNVMTAFFMVAGAGVIAALSVIGYGARDIFLLLGCGGIAVTIYVIRIIPDETLKLVAAGILKALYRVDVRGLEHLKSVGDKAVIVVNHVSFLDAAIVGAFLPGRSLFAINTQMARRWWVRPFLRLVDAFPLDPTNPLGLRAIVKAVDAGRHCVIFPEGRLTVTGALMKIYEGPGLIADRAKAPLIPVHLDGVQYLPFTRLRGRVRTKLFPKITMTVLPARPLQVAADVVGRARRKAVGRALHDVMTNLAFVSENIDTTLFEVLLRARSLHGPGTPILEDTEREPLNYRGLIAGCLALGRHLAGIAPAGANVGVLLPTSNAAAVTFFALQAAGRVPALLNFTAGTAGLTAACTAAQIDRIITARRFAAAAKLEIVIGALPSHIRVLYLEDIRQSLGLGAKLAGLIARAAPRLVWRRPRNVTAESPAVVLFTSGSEGTPKGVVLSHRNLLANRAQVSAVIDFGPSDIVFNALPVFHAFGLSGGLLLPLLSGVKTFLYPSPLHYRIIPELIYDTNATIVFGTDTFLAGYARVANPYDFYSVRYVFAGAERVKPETRKAFIEGFGLRILEGYGATETAPILALNTAMHFKLGTVGRFMPGVDARLEEVPGVAEAKRLYVRGPNIMKGYLKADRPGELQPPVDGWYDTGDLVSLDDEGFVTILGRAKRFAKIAGEMVSLGAVEELTAALWPDAVHAAVTVPDPRRGESLVLVTTRKDADRAALLKAAQDKGLPELGVPRAIRVVDKMPLLGTGKTDYRAVEALAREAAPGDKVDA